MPIYEYQCQKCGHQFEKRQGINEKPVSRCPVCKGKVEKQWSQTSFQLKGSGWYVTDYAGKKDEKRSEKPAETKAETTTETKTESGSTDKKAETAKPAKTEAKPKGKGSNKSAD